MKGDDKKVHMVQTGKAGKKMVCWNCGEKGHGVKTCPKCAAREESDNENIHARTSNATESNEDMGTRHTPFDGTPGDGPIANLFCGHWEIDSLQATQATLLALLQSLHHWPQGHC